MHAVKPLWEKAFAVVAPQISAEGVHVWPFDPSFPLDVRFLIQGRRHPLRMNRHDYLEIAHLCSETAEVHVQERQFPMREGDLLLMGSTQYHRIDSGPSRQATLAVLFFKPEIVRAAATLEDAPAYLLPFLSQDTDFPHVVPAGTGIPAEVLDLIHRIRRELPAGSSRARLAVKTYLKMILMLLVNHYAQYSATPAVFDRKHSEVERLRPLFEYIERHYDEPIHVDTAARLCLMSNSHFMYFFKRVTGQPFLNYLNHYRIERAEALLTSTGKSISEVTQETGFCDQSYFGTVFRKVVGMTPMEYRRRFRADNQSSLPALSGPVAHVPETGLFATPPNISSAERRGASQDGQRPADAGNGPAHHASSPPSTKSTLPLT